MQDTLILSHVLASKSPPSLSETPSSTSTLIQSHTSSLSSLMSISSSVLFQNYPFNFHDDLTISVRYRNLFDIMVDAVVSTLVVAEYQTILVVVIEIGWPTRSVVVNEVEMNLGYMKNYLRGLVKHMRSGIGTPLLKDRMHEVFV
ncbi:hypothetical protein RJT34_02018 [Clitoria ternatea]|uniref:glucan endo-1,3-beta-D-glucosidase n=1 Tax=Clitoria ternatea TaxID=43366 RepID=A0AAN9KK03_CLITE